MTQAEAMSWLNSTKGQHLDYDKVYGQQCFDYFNYYYQALTGDSPYADGFGVSGAKDIWNVATTRFTKIANSNSLIPQPGDVLIYGSTWGAGYGHVEVCLSSDTYGSTLIGENEDNDPSEGVVKVYRTWAQMAGLIGVMRPHFDPAITNQGGDMTNTSDLDFLYQTMLGRARDSANHEGEDVYLNKDYRFVATDLYNSKEAQTRRAAAAKQFTDLQAQVATLQKSVDSLTAANLKLTAQLQNQPTVSTGLDPATKAEIDNTNSIVQWIKDKLSAIFN